MRILKLKIQLGKPRENLTLMRNSAYAENTCTCSKISRIQFNFTFMFYLNLNVL